MPDVESTAGHVPGLRLRWGDLLNCQLHVFGHAKPPAPPGTRQPAAPLREGWRTRRTRPGPPTRAPPDATAGPASSKPARLREVRGPVRDEGSNRRLARDPVRLGRTRRTAANVRVPRRRPAGRTGHHPAPPHGRTRARKPRTAAVPAGAGRRREARVGASGHGRDPRGLPDLCKGAIRQLPYAAADLVQASPHRQRSPAPASGPAERAPPGPTRRTGLRPEREDVDEPSESSAGPERRAVGGVFIDTRSARRALPSTGEYARRPRPGPRRERSTRIGAYRTACPWPTA